MNERYEMKEMAKEGETEFGANDNTCAGVWFQAHHCDSDDGNGGDGGDHGDHNSDTVPLDQ